MSLEIITYFEIILKNRPDWFILVVETIVVLPWVIVFIYVFKLFVSDYTL